MQSLESIRQKREASVWTAIHPIFAIGQLGVFLTSLILIVLYFLHVVPFVAVHLSVMIKMVFMIGAIVTGSLWEHDVFGKWWFAHEFFIEDVMTANVFALHVGYLITYYAWANNGRAVLSMLGVAYLVYALNVGQYILSHVKMNGSGGAAHKKGATIAA